MDSGRNRSRKLLSSNGTFIFSLLLCFFQSQNKDTMTSSSSFSYFLQGRSSFLFMIDQHVDFYNRENVALGSTQG